MRHVMLLLAALLLAGSRTLIAQPPDPDARETVLLYGHEGRARIDTVHDTVSIGRPAFSVGVDGGANWSYFDQIMTWTPQISSSPLRNLAGGSGYGSTIGALIDIPSSRTSDLLSIQIRAAYDDHRFGIGDSTGAYDLQAGHDASTVPGVVAHSYTASVSYLDLAARIRWQPIGGLFLFTGPVVKARISELTFYERERITSPAGTVFPATALDSLTRNTVVGTAALLRYGVEFGAGYRLRITPVISVVPQIAWQPVLSSVADDETSLASEGDGDQSRALGGKPADVSYTHRRLGSLQGSVGIWVQF
jgi:hypothetical protein